MHPPTKPLHYGKVGVVETPALVYATGLLATSYNPLANPLKPCHITHTVTAAHLVDHRDGGGRACVQKADQQALPLLSGHQVQVSCEQRGLPGPGLHRCNVRRFACGNRGV